MAGSRRVQGGAASFRTAIGAAQEQLEDLRDLLDTHGLRDVVVLTFPESKLKDASTKLRKGLGLGAAGLAVVTADDLAEHADE